MMSTTTTTTYDTEGIRLYHGPSWATDWCPHCGWDSRCARCRAWMD